MESIRLILLSGLHLYLPGFEVPQVIDAYHSVRQSKSLFNALPFDISPVNPSQVFRQENRKCIANPQHISKLQLFPSSNLSGWIKRTISDTQGPCAVRRSAAALPEVFV